MLLRYFHETVADPNATSYQPVVAVFATAFAMALAATWAATGTLTTVRAGEWVVAFSMCILAILKRQNLETFSNMFLSYDLLAQRVVRYAYVYPFGEAIAGVAVVAGGPSSGSRFRSRYSSAESEQYLSSRASTWIDAS